MAHKPLLVSNGFLQEYEFGIIHAPVILVESVEWYDWLQQHRSFHFEHHGMVYTARKEQRPGGWYWYASRRISGTLYTLYLGKSEDLTQERLSLVGQQFGNTPPSSSSTVKREALFLPALPESLLTTKLTIPQSRVDLVPRPQLIARMQSELRRKLLIVVAPAGYGKTTLLSTWTAQSDIPVAWVSLDERDNEALRFWSYVLAAVDSLRPGTANAFLPLLSSSQALFEESFLTTFINMLASISKHIALVFDDYHLIHSDTIHTALTFLIEHLPPNIHLVLACRNQPPLSLARL